MGIRLISVSEIGSYGIQFKKKFSENIVKYPIHISVFLSQIIGNPRIDNILFFFILITLSTLVNKLYFT